MSIPVSKEAQAQLEKVIADNEAAGDWLYSSLPGDDVPTIRVDQDVTADDVVNAVGKQPAPKPKN